jgi:hypothetical protein
VGRVYYQEDDFTEVLGKMYFVWLS